jgi:hypothetical protein
VQAGAVGGQFDRGGCDRIQLAYERAARADHRQVLPDVKGVHPTPDGYVPPDDSSPEAYTFGMTWGLLANPESPNWNRPGKTTPYRTITLLGRFAEGKVR